MIFTMALWVVAVFLLCSNHKNKTNRWSAFCFLTTSIGTFKEFLIEAMVPYLKTAYPQIDSGIYVTIDSCLISVLYLFFPFCLITMSMYFSDWDRKKPGLVPVIQGITAFVIIIIILFYHPTQFKYYQLYRKDFWYVITVFNIGYALAACSIMFRYICGEADQEIRKRKRTILKVFLPPYFYWLITIFLVHTVNIEPLKKIWKGNVYIMIAVLAYYAYLAYREGFMGLKISFVKYDWNSQLQSINSSTQYINHMLKNHITKINWSVDNIRKKLGDEKLEELDIIERSTRQLMGFTEKTNRCLSPKLAGEDWCGASNLIFEALEEFRMMKHKDISINVECTQDILIKCDAQSIVEVIYNLVKNAIEAIHLKGNIGLAAFQKKDDYCIEITDNGVGISNEQMSQLFLPFYTTKKNNVNFGIGLPYCKNVMQAHGGSIEAGKTREGLTRFTLTFPAARVRRKESAINEQQDKGSYCRG